jgi:hypothetical protein
LCHVHVWEIIEILVMDLEETEAKTDCAGEGQQQFNRPKLAELGSFDSTVSRRSESALIVLICFVSSRYLAATSEQVHDLNVL